VPWVVRHADGTAYAPAEYPLARALAGEAVLGEVMVLERHDGSTSTIEVDAAPVRTGGVNAGAVAVFQDVTERVETRSRLARTTRRLEQTLAVTDAALSGLSFDDLADRLLRTVREVLETDTATLFLVDRSGAALVEHMTVGAETDGSSIAVPFGRGIAGTIASTVAPLVVDDVSAYQVVRPWLARTTRSLMGAPLVYRGRVKGVIHVGSRTARHFTSDEVEVLELAANRIASALERASLYDSRSAMSAALQESLLPSSLPRVDGLDLAALYLPFSPDDEIGGDFYDVYPHGDGTWGVVVGDVSGKGPQAAATMGIAAHSVRVLARYESRPSEVLRSLNEMLLRAEAVATERFCTACEMRVRVATDHLRVTVCVAGHPLPLIVRSDGAIEQAGEPGTLLGTFEDPRLHDVTFDLAPGDSLVAFTDGLVERRGSDLEEGEGRLAEVLRSCASASAEEIVRRIRRELIERVAIDDDVAVVVIKSR
jgi:phosphoserine phosphatase RsbU/P